jgi:hypothetical protein
MREGLVVLRMVRVGGYLKNKEHGAVFIEEKELIP